MPTLSWVTRQAVGNAPKVIAENRSVGGSPAAAGQYQRGVAEPRAATSTLCGIAPHEGEAG